MFKNLLAELIKNNMEISKLAEILNISTKVLNMKLLGKKEFELVECLKIQELIGDKNICLEYLFKKSKKPLV